MKTKILKSALPAVLLLGLSAPASDAAAIAFSQEAYADSAISTTGTLVGALNVNAAETVNTVPFSAIATSYTNPITLGSGVSLDAFNGGGTTVGADDLGAPGALTSDFFYTSGAGTGYLTFLGLTVAQPYELQMVMSDTRVVSMNIWGDQTTNAGASDIFVDHGQSASKLVTGTFTADGTGSQSLYVEVLAGFPGHFNALQLRAVPEPSAALLSIFGAAGLLFRRRRTAR